MVAMSHKVTALRRDLTREDMERMNIPLRYWKVSFGGISAERQRVRPEIPSAQETAQSYLEKIDEMTNEGVGLLLHGPNGTGKTSMSVVIAMEFRRRGNRVLFIEAASLKQYVINKVYFDGDEGELYWDRAMSVDVLVIDDFGKGTQDKTGFGARLFDELIRHRNSEKLVTFLTTNMDTRDGSENSLSRELLPSTMHSLKECVIPVEVTGDDRRDAILVDMRDRLNT